MLPNLFAAIEGWSLSMLLYPGLLFAALLILCGEWVASASATPGPRAGRQQTRQRSFFQPVHNLVKLAGRRRAALWSGPAHTGAEPYIEAVALLGVAAPLLALAVMPFPASPLAVAGGYTADLLLLLGLLVAQPLVHALLRLRAGGLEGWSGAQDIGRLFTGLVPVLLAVTSLVAVSGASSLQVARLGAAPETAAQTIVRLLAGLALMIALPWWTAKHGRSESAQSAALFVGDLAQRLALAAFWALLVLPAPGDLSWAIALYVSGTLFAYVAIRQLALRWAPARREKDAANLAWAATLPAAALALLLAFL